MSKLCTLPCINYQLNIIKTGLLGFIYSKVLLLIRKKAICWPLPCTGAITTYLYDTSDRTNLNATFFIQMPKYFIPKTHLLNLIFLQQIRPLIITQSHYQFQTTLSIDKNWALFLLFFHKKKRIKNVE